MEALQWVACTQGAKYSKASKTIALNAPTSCLDALEISLLFCYTLTCNCLMKAMCPLKRALKMGASQISYFEACLYFGPDYAILRRRASHTLGHRPTCLVSKGKVKESSRFLCLLTLLPDFCVCFLIFPPFPDFFFHSVSQFLGGNS